MRFKKDLNINNLFRAINSKADGYEEESGNAQRLSICTNKSEMLRFWCKVSTWVLSVDAVESTEDVCSNGNTLFSRGRTTLVE